MSIGVSSKKNYEEIFNFVEPVEESVDVLMIDKNK